MEMQIVLCGDCDWLGLDTDLIDKPVLDKTNKILKKNQFAFKVCPCCASTKIFYKVQKNVVSLWNEENSQSNSQLPFPTDDCVLPQFPFVEDENPTEDFSIDEALLEEALASAELKSEDITNIPLPEGAKLLPAKKLKTKEIMQSKRSKPKSKKVEKSKIEKDQEQEAFNFRTVANTKKKFERKCDLCGRLFESRGAGDQRCPECLAKLIS
jgi:hypothetical protein